MTPKSEAWRRYLDDLREVAQLLVADPQSRFGKKQYSPPVLGRGQEVRLSAALSRGALVLTCSHLQGYFLSVVQEFLERVDSASVEAGRLPIELRAKLCLRFPVDSDDEVMNTAAVHTTYAPLWRDAERIPPGTIRTDSLTDPSANPWPTTVRAVLMALGIDIFDFIGRDAGGPRVTAIKTQVNELVMSRNKLAHGDDSVQVTADDVRRLMQWSTRFARDADRAMDSRLRDLTGVGWQP